MKRVLCYGVVGVDHLIQVKGFPEANGHARVERDEIQVGGEAANTAVRLTQLGVPVTLMGNPVGDDAYGRLFRDEMAKHDVDCRIGHHRERTGHAYVVSDSEGSRTIFGAFGELVGPSVPEELWDELALVSVDPFVEGAVDVCRGARLRQIPTMSIEIEADNELAGLVDTVINSAGFLRRHEAGDPDSIARQLLGVGVETVITTRGDKGAEVHFKSGAFHQNAYSSEVIDTTGAGDAFRAGLIAGFLGGRDLAASVAQAAACGALSCCYHGGCGGVLDPEMVAATVSTA